LTDTALGKKTDKTPVWLFRQAGRHLPEYAAYKEKTGLNFLGLLKDPEHIAECTMQPVRRYPVDAAILFSDILVVPQALGISVTMPGGVGIQVPSPLTNVDMLSSVTEMCKDTKVLVEDNMGYVLEGVRRIKESLRDEGYGNVPLIGFSAAPWTLFYYMLGGSSKKNTDVGVRWIEDNPVASRELMEGLADVVIEYASRQIESGADAIQIFEAMGMMISPEMFDKFASPYLIRVGEGIKSRHPGVPLIVFARGAGHGNKALSESGFFDVITIDGTVDVKDAREKHGGGKALQGNFDPRFLVPGDHTGEDVVRREVRKMLEGIGCGSYIANLGEGLGGKESTELVKVFVDAVHEISEEMMKE